MTTEGFTDTGVPLDDIPNPHLPHGIPDMGEFSQLTGPFAA